MTRTYPIPSSMDPEAALARVTDLFQPWGYRWADIDHSAYSIKVSADPIVFTVIEPAVRFELHETQGCNCAPCRNLAEVTA